MDGAGFGEGADPNNGPEGGVIDGSVEPIGIVRASTKSSGETGTRGTAWLARSSREGGVGAGGSSGAGK